MNYFDAEVACFVSLLELHEYINVRVLLYQSLINICFRGYCTPDQFCDCLCIWLKNYNTLVTGKICLLVDNISRNLTTALEFY